jgi:hypothetical protein
MTQEQKPKPQPGQCYTAGTHIIDKALLNFTIGLAVAIALGLSIITIFIRKQQFSCCPVILFAIIVAGIVYAFGFLGAIAASTREKSYKVTMLSALGATYVGSFCFVFPIFFVQSIIYFIRFLIPRYSLELGNYVPRLTNMRQYLENKYCHIDEFCLWNTAVGGLIGALMDTVILGVGMVLLFSLVNTISAVIKVSSDVKPSQNK